MIEQNPRNFGEALAVIRSQRAIMAECTLMADGALSGCHRIAYLPDHIRIATLADALASIKLRLSPSRVANTDGDDGGPYSAPVQHGVTCPKAYHVGGEYMHGEHDDGPFYIDDIAYCGRCHTHIVL